MAKKKRATCSSEIAQPILDCWNAQYPRGRLKRHLKVDPEMNRAIAENIEEGWEVEDMCEAIVNFCAAVSNRDMSFGNNDKYSQAYQKWGLFEFLHRGCSDDDKGKRWIKFTDNRWQEKDHLTREAINRRISAQRREEQQDLGREILKESVPDRISYKNMLDKDLLIAYDNANGFVKGVIQRIRPELFNKEQK